MSTRPLGPAHQGRTLIGRTAAALALAGAGVLAATGGANAAETCTTPGVSNGALAGVDNTVNVYAAGDFTVDGAAEAEGVVVVGGDFSTDKFYNVGVAGVGSRVSPAPGSVMLRVGGNAEGAGTVDVGSGIGGDATVGGSVASSLTFELNGGSLSQNATAATALGTYANLASTLQDESARLAGLAATPGAKAYDDGTYVTFDGDGTSSQQVFTVKGSELSAKKTSIKFTGIPDDATVVVNVTGDVTTNIDSVWDESTILGPSSPELGPLASHTVWNILTDKSPEISGGAQWIGSVLVPTADGTTTVDVPGLNGRTWVAGNLVHKAGTGTGNEFHNYPFTGSEVLTCTTDTTPTNDKTPTDDQTPSDEESPSDEKTDTPGDDSTETPSDDTTDTPSDDRSTPPTTDEDTSSTTPADVASPSPTGTTVVLAAGGTASPTPTTTAQGEGVLAHTGANAVPFAVVAAVLVAAGATLLVLRRRRAA